MYLLKTSKELTEDTIKTSKKLTAENKILQNFTKRL